MFIKILFFSSKTNGHHRKVKTGVHCPLRHICTPKLPLRPDTQAICTVSALDTAICGTVHPVHFAVEIEKKPLRPVQKQPKKVDTWTPMDTPRCPLRPGFHLLPMEVLPMSKTIVLPSFTVRAGMEEAHWPVVPLGEALRASYPGKGSLLQYAPGDADEYPRLRKSDIIYHLGEENPVKLRQLFFDIDHPTSSPEDGWHLSVLGRLPDELRSRLGWYRTRGGMRLVGVLPAPLALQYADDYIARWHAQMASYGIDVDPATTDWTRLSKAPRAQRLDLPMDLTAIDAGRFLPDIGGELRIAEPQTLGEAVARRMPDPAEKLRRVTKDDVRGVKPKTFADDIRLGRLAFRSGERHNGFLDAAARLAAQLNTADPLVIYELLAPSAQTLGSPLDDVWRTCEWVASAQAATVDEDAETASSLVERAAEVMGCAPSEVATRLIMDTGPSFYVFDEEEMAYVAGYTKESQLLAAILRHCPILFGEIDTTTPAQLRVGRSTVPEHVVWTYTDKPAFDETSRTFYHRVCRVDEDLSPRYDEDIAQWLYLLLDGNERALDWLACLPDLRRSVCALYINGEPSVGKGLLTLGLARLWTKESVTVPYASMLGTFNSELLRSPLIIADEAVPQDAFAQNDSSLFRRLVGNPVGRLRDLYKSPGTLAGHARVLITANNSDALKIREELDADDIAALQVRVGYVRARDEAAEFLRDYAHRKGHASVAPAVDDWIEGGGIARHVLHLAQTRQVQHGTRFAVDGWPSAFTHALRTGVGGASAVIGAVAWAIVKNHQGPSVEWGDGKVWVNQNELAADWFAIIGHQIDRPPSEAARTKALRSLATENVRRANRSGHRLRYWEIEGDVIVEAAERLGDVDPVALRARIFSPASQTMKPASQTHYEQLNGEANSGR